MERRQLLRTSTMVGTALIAGCVASSDDQDIQDSDGDGVIDSEDYAPHDPDVQEKSDLEDASSAIKRTETETDSEDSDTDTDPENKDEPETENSTADADSNPETESDTQTEENGSKTSPAEANTLEVDDKAFEGDSHISSYSSREVTGVIDPADPELSNQNLSNYDVQLLATWFPRESIVTDAIDDSSLESQSKTAITFSIDISDVAPDKPLQYILFLVPSGETIETAKSADIIYLHETDPFLLKTDSVTIERAAIPELESLGDDSGRNHSRTAKEGVLQLSFEGRTEGRGWNVSFYTFKSSYVEAVQRDHGRSRPQFVDYEMTSGFGWEVAELLGAEAERNGFTDKRMQVEFVIDFIQNLPYVPDDVSKGHDDYTKFAMETITECGGDCEDTAILLTSVLQTDPFGYDLVLIQPPEHMAAGIKGADDLPGYYWEYDGNKYYYIETTGVGWGIGDLPDEYKGVQARVHQV